MSLKDNLTRAYDYLVSDPEILTLMDLEGAGPEEIQLRICKTRTIGNVADEKIRIAIWESDSIPYSSRVSGHTLVIDVLAPLYLHRQTGVVLDILSRVRKVLDRKPIGRGLKFEKFDPDESTARGWYKGSIKFYYNFKN